MSLYEPDNALFNAAQEEYWRAIESRLPSRVYRPKLFIDGDQWCALYGDDLQAGVAGFGNTPALAMEDFDKNWNSQVAHSPATPEEKPDAE